MAWEMYDELIGGIPEGIVVVDFCKGLNWCYVEAESGLGIAKMVRGGVHRSQFKGDYRDLDLRSVAALVKSWNFGEASMGMAALGAWYTQPGRLAQLEARIDAGESPAGRDQNPFSLLRRDYVGKKLAVVGHFPNVDAASKVCDITVLERECRSPLDVPDSACEFVLPEQDFVFMTGTTLTNKTMPRLLQLCKDPFTVVTGPSALPAQAIVDAGANMVAGSVVVDVEPAKMAIRGGSKAQWRAGIKKFYWEPDSSAGC